MREKFGFLVTLARHDLWLPCWMVRYKNILVPVESSTGLLGSGVKEVLCVWWGCWLHTCLCVATDWNVVMLLFVIVVQSLSCVRLSATPWTEACQACLSFTISWSLLKLMSIESMVPSNHLILCHPLLLLPSIFLSIRVFSNESALCIRWPKYWSFSFSISPSNEYSGLISFRVDRFDYPLISEEEPSGSFQGRGNELPQPHGDTLLYLPSWMDNPWFCHLWEHLCL